MLFCLVAALFPWRSSAAEPIIWGYADLPPYIYTLEDGQPYGPFADIVKNVFRHTNIDYRTQFAPNRRARKSINDGSVNFSIGPLIPLKNPNDFHISRNVVSTIEMQVYWIGNKEPVTQASELDGQSVILIASFDYSGLRTYVENPENNVTLAVNVEDHKRALLALSKGRASYMLGYREPVDLMQLEMNVKNLNSYSLKKTEIYLVINKMVENSRQIMDRLDAAYSILYPNNVNGINTD